MNTNQPIVSEWHVKYRTPLGDVSTDWFLSPENAAVFITRHPELVVISEGWADHRLDY